MALADGWARLNAGLDSHRTLSMNVAGSLVPVASGWAACFDLGFYAHDLSASMNVAGCGACADLCLRFHALCPAKLAR